MNEYYKTELHAVIFNKKKWSWSEVVRWIMEHQKYPIAIHNHPKSWRVTLTPARNDKIYRSISNGHGITLVFAYTL